ncbi:hypothetical protein B566_EDAN005630 [Ephemera danica]|nr:hypothetical protein B566_EDAN005630 [Ephemera danica]
MNEKIRVLLVDDHALFRSGVKTLLQRHDEFEVVDEAADGLEGIKRARSLKPDVVLLDLNLPGVGGLEAVKVIAEEIPGARVLVLTVSENAEDLMEALRAGACGYLLKNIEMDALLDSVRRAARGDSVVSPQMTAKLIDGVRENTRGPGTPLERDRFSPRERDLLVYLAQGESNKEIARALDLAESTRLCPVTEFLERQFHRVAADGEGDGIAAVARGKDGETPVEGAADALGADGEALGPAEQVNAVDALAAQSGPACLMEGQGVEGSRSGIRVESVDQDVVEQPVAAQHVIGPVGNDYVEALRVVRQLEKLAGDELDLRVDLHGGDTAGGQVAVNELGQRPGAEPDQQGAAWPGGRAAHEQAGHHVAGVSQLKRPWPGDTHGTLDPVGAKVQVTHTGFFANIDGVAWRRGASEHGAKNRVPSPGIEPRSAA